MEKITRSALQALLLIGLEKKGEGEKMAEAEDNVMLETNAPEAYLGFGFKRVAVYNDPEFLAMDQIKPVWVLEGPRVHGEWQTNRILSGFGLFARPYRQKCLFDTPAFVQTDRDWEDLLRRLRCEEPALYGERHGHLMVLWTSLTEKTILPYLGKKNT